MLVSKTLKINQRIAYRKLAMQNLGDELLQEQDEKDGHIAVQDEVERDKVRILGCHVSATYITTLVSILPGLICTETNNVICVTKCVINHVWAKRCRFITLFK